jgi:diguanylate cyclase (GGDEF)-like protein
MALETSPWTGAPAISGPMAVGLFLIGGANAALLLHTLRKVRSQDWVVALGWGVGGAVAVGTGLWLMHLLAWRDAHEASAAWFQLGPFLAAWCAAVAGVALAVFAGRSMPTARSASPWVAIACVLTMAAVFVLMGLALAQPPQWAAWAVAPAAAALAIASLGFGASLPLLHGHGRRTTRRSAGPRALGISVFALALLASQLLALQALPVPLPVDERQLLMQMPPDAIDARLARLLVVFALFVVVMGLVCAIVDSRTGRRAQALAGSLQSANRRLQELAFRDALTGLPNRLHFEEQLDATLALVGRSSASMAVCFIDLDGFKAVNESFGHAAGDEVLREVGRRLSGQKRPGDSVARIGGDEFLLLLAEPGSQERVAALAQQALHALMAPYPLPTVGTGGSEVRLSCSVGIAIFPEHGPMSRLITHADAAMFAVKRTGGSTYAFFDPRMELDASDQLELQTDLRQAIERGELALYYQPKVDARSRECTGVEALVRWQHPKRGAVGPTELIAVAERFGLIGAIGQWVIDEACRQMRSWDDEGLRLRVAVNLSAQQLRQDDLVQRIRQSFEAHRVDASLFAFEITESVAMEDTSATMRTFAQLARAGVALAIDDFGTGHSSLAYLRTLPARQLKIDRSFIGDLGLSGDAMAVVDAVIRLAHALGLRVVAEGVETDRQCEILATLGCDEFQGYLFARPMQAQQVAAWLAAGPQRGSAAGDGFEPTQPPRVLQ